MREDSNLAFQKKLLHLQLVNSISRQCFTLPNHLFIILTQTGERQERRWKKKKNPRPSRELCPVPGFWARAAREAALASFVARGSRLHPGTRRPRGLGCSQTSGGRKQPPAPECFTSHASHCTASKWRLSRDKKNGSFLLTANRCIFLLKRSEMRESRLDFWHFPPQRKR